MNRIDNLRGDIAEARTAVARSLAGAYAEWELRPAAEEWSARENAEHVVENELFFAGELARLKGLQAPSMEPRPLETPGAAVDAIFMAGVLAHLVLDAFEDADLALDWAHGMSVADLLELYASHARDHVAQIDAAIGVLTG